MKTLSSLPGLVAALLLTAHFSPLAAQYNAPPPPEQQNTGEPADPNAPPPMDQGAPPPSADQSAPPPADDQNAPPPADQGNMQDQGAPPPDQDQGAPPPDAADDQGAPPPDQGGDASGDANFQTFYNDLSSQGNWVQTDNYGYVWQPNESDPDWAPYTDGHWVYTDEGWTWVAADSEPWGWATYHYGRWTNLDGYGWCWVPGYTWAPAWVSWRYGGGYCGWAPLPPDTFVGIDFGGVDLGFHIGDDCDTAYGIGPGYYNFIPVGDIGERDYRHHFVNRNDNFRIIGNTRNVTSINVNNQRGAGRFGRVSTGGPDLTRINAESHTPVQQVSLSRSNHAGASSLSGNRLSVFAPQVRAAATGATFRPRSVSGNAGNARVNNGTNISDPLQVNSRIHGQAATSAQIAAASSTRFSSTAQVATPNTRPTEALTKPLSSFQPHNETRVTRTTAARTNPAHNAATTATRADNAFTGEAGTTTHTGNTEIHNGAQTHTATPDVQQKHPSLTTSQGHHDYTLGAVHSQEHHESAPVQHTETAPVQHQAAAPQEHHDSAPVQPQEHHESAPVQQQEHHESAPVQHTAPAPQEHHSAPQPRAQHSAPAPQSHPSGGGGKGGDDHSSGNGGNNNDHH